MSRAQTLITEHIATWTGAIQAKSTAGRGSSNKYELYGIKKLRELILELAVRGKLVPQDPSDEPASVLLERITAEKTELIKQGKIKKSKALPPVSDEEKPFELPDGWEWCRLGELGYTQTGGTPSKSKPHYFGSDIPFIKPADITAEGVNYNNEGLTYEGAENLGRLAPSGSILMVCIGTIGKSFHIEKDCTFNQQINSITPYIDNTLYLGAVLSSPYFQLLAWENSSSTTIAILNKGKWENLPIPLPSLAEQQRIVQKVDELMALCDQLEQQTESSIQAHATLVDTLLATLTNSADADELQQNWGRIAGHFDTLFTTEQSIDALKQTILQLAVMGKLVRQNPEDEPAAVLLKRIAAEKDRLVKEKKIKKQKPLPEISDDEKPFELPGGWEWSRFNTTISPEHSLSYGVLVPGESKDDGIPFVRISDIAIDHDGSMPERKISPEVNAKFLKTQLDGGEILMAVVGSIGKIGVAPKSWKGANIARALCRIKLSELVNKNYILTLLQSSFMQNSFMGDTRTLAQPTLNIGLIKNSLTPIPPFEEQQRIVAKVDELIALCDQLKDKLRQSQQTQVHLTDAIVEQTLA